MQSHRTGPGAFVRALVTGSLTISRVGFIAGADT
ncbi:hypothetical protein RKD18_007776 [Streptomyces phaeoluteigriseus]